MGVGPNVGSVLRANGECRGAGRKVDGAGPDLFSEINLPEMQKLKQQLIQVGPLFQPIRERHSV